MDTYIHGCITVRTLLCLIDVLSLLKIDKNEEQTAESIDDIKDDTPNDLADIVMQVKTPWVAFITFIGCHCIQLLQLYVVRVRLENDSTATGEDVDSWFNDGLVAWKDDETRAAHNTSPEINVLEAFRTGTVELTDKGVAESRSNIAIGMLLLLAFYASEIHTIFVTNEYHIQRACTSLGVRMMSSSVLYGQIIVASWVVFVCAQGIMTGSLDTAATIAHSIETFFILEIDDKLLPVIWSCVKGIHEPHIICPARIKMRLLNVCSISTCVDPLFFTNVYATIKPSPPVSTRRRKRCYNQRN